MIAQPAAAGSGAARRAGRGRWWLAPRHLHALPAALLALMLLALATRQLVGVLLAAPGEPVLQNLQTQRGVSTEDLRRLLAAQQRAVPWLREGRARTDLGLAWLLYAERLPSDDPQSAAALGRAVEQLRLGLGRSPANPYAWARLAYAEAIGRGWAPPAVSALRLALVTAPFEPRLLWSRLRMSLLAWSQLAGEDRELVLQQIRTAWRVNPAEALRLVQETGQLNLLRAALVRTPDDAARLERMLSAAPAR